MYVYIYIYIYTYYIYNIISMYMYIYGVYIHTHCITIPVLPEPHKSSPAETTPLTWFRPHPGRKGGLLEHACRDEEPNGTKRTTFIRCLERYLACKYPGDPRNSKDIPACILRWDVIVNASHIIFYSHRWYVREVLGT